MPTPSKILCPHCKLPVPYDAALAGTVAECPFCGEAYRVPQVAPTPPAKAARRLDAATQPTFSVPAATEGTQAPPPLPGERAPSHQGGGAAGVIELGDQWEEADSIENRPAVVRLSRGSVRRWQRVRSGLAIMQIGYIFGLIGALMIMGLAPWQSPAHRETIFRSRQAGDVLLSTCGCSAIGILALLVGQALTAAAPSQRARNAALSSLGATFGALFFLVMQSIATSGSTTTPWLPTLFVVALLIGAHLLFVHFHAVVARHFGDKGIARQTKFYLGFFCIYVGVSAIALLQAFRFERDNLVARGAGDQELMALGAICWSCFDLFLVIALLSLMQRTRTLIHDRLGLRPDPRRLQG